jgi:hypothetical protein
MARVKKLTAERIMNLLRQVGMDVRVTAKVPL